MVLPVLMLMLTSVAAWSRYQRDSMLEVLHTDYVRTARAKGVPRRQIIRRHALRNALIPFVTVVAIDAGVLLGGVVVVETIFSWPGLGLLFFDALQKSDYPVMLAWMAVATVFVVLFNLARRHPVRACSTRASASAGRTRTPTAGAVGEHPVDARRRRWANRHEHAHRRRVGPRPGGGDRPGPARDPKSGRHARMARRRVARRAGDGSAATGWR